MANLRRFKLSKEQKASVKDVRNANAHKVVEAAFGGVKTINLDAVALTQDLGYVINRARQIRMKNARLDTNETAAES